jgi:hypothetical protein
MPTLCYGLSSLNGAPSRCRNIAIRLQYLVKAEEYGGPMDIAIHAKTPSKMPVVYIVEAKKSDADQGRAQLYPQLKFCYEQGKAKEEWDHPIYGVISTADKWIFVRYDGKRWVEAEPLAITTVHDRNGVQKVVEAFFKIIRYQNEVTKVVIAKYTKPED